MSLVARIKTLANGKNISIAELEWQCMLGNGTIRKWDYQSPSVDKITRLADWLNVSLNYLLIEDCSSYEKLNEMKERLIQMYRELDRRDQQDVWESTLMKLNRSKRGVSQDSDSGVTA